jgi:hypothetical protein
VLILRPTLALDALYCSCSGVGRQTKGSVFVTAIGLVVAVGAAAGCESTAAETTGAQQDAALASASASALTAAPPAASAAGPSCAEGGVCALGDTRPGGGLVFYVASSLFSAPGTACGDNCKYLKTLVNDSSGSMAWCAGPGAAPGFSVDALGAVIGTGWPNTQAMLGTRTHRQLRSAQAVPPRPLRLRLAGSRICTCHRRTNCGLSWTPREAISASTADTTSRKWDSGPLLRQVARTTRRPTPSESKRESPASTIHNQSTPFVRSGPRVWESGQLIRARRLLSFMRGQGVQLRYLSAGT